VKNLYPFFFSCLLGVVLFIPKESFDTIYTINVTLSGAQEVPPVASLGTGTLTGTYDDATNTLTFTIVFSGLLSPTNNAHFHAPAPPGVNAPVVIGFVPGFPLGVFSGAYSDTFMLTAGQESQLLCGLWYVNIHTNMFPGGEIRGQLQGGTLPATLTVSETHVDATCNMSDGSIDITASGGTPISLVQYYIDSFNGPNDTASLRSRGYEFYRNGTFSGVATGPWFQGNPLVFPAFNGDSNDYVGSNFQSAGTLGDIDNWLVLPSQDVVAGDSICFYSRSPLASTFPDTIRVMYNPLGGTLPSSPGWIELGRFKVNTSGIWELKSFIAPSSALSARFAIRYSVVNSGSLGSNGDYIGIDALALKGLRASYSYLWSDGNMNEDRNNLGAGMYSVTVTDINGCSASISVSITAPNCCVTPAVIYVDSAATGLNDGSSWANAFIKLQDALKSCDPDTILVAQGTYYPDEGMGYTDNARDSSFNIPDSAVVLGGYEGNAGDTSAARDWVCNKTILCGEIQQDGDSSNNSYHVVVTTNVDSTTVVDGFCILDGYANGDENYGGGGWYNNGSGEGNSSNPTIRNSVFRGNFADYGGAMFNDGSENGNSSPLLTNCILSGNDAFYGGAMFNDGFDGGNSSPELTNCILSGNNATVYGGAMFNDGFDGGNSSPELFNCILSGNNAGVGGGAMYNRCDGNCNPVLANCILWNNNSIDGPVFFNSNAIPVVFYSILQGGGGINDPSVSFNELGGFTFDFGNNKFQDPLFIFAPPASSASTSAGNFHVLSTSPAIDMGLNAANPYPTDLDGNPRIQNGTIDIGAYETSFFICDSFPTGIVYVDAAATGSNNGTNWLNAYTDLQAALAVAWSCDQVDSIKVAQGTYYPSGFDTLIVIDSCTNLPSDTFYIVPNRSVSFNIPDSVKVLGGYFAGTEDRDWICNKTILCGDIDRNGDTSGNSYHVVTTFNVDSSTTVDGFCILDGNANGEDEPDNQGGGWYNEASNGETSSPTIRNSIFSGNFASKDGGGMFNVIIDGGSLYPTYINTIFRGNAAGEDGGAVATDGADDPWNLEFINSIFSGNLAGEGGSALYSDGGVNSGANIINSVINGNNAIEDTAAILSEGGSIINLINSIVWNNSSAFQVEDGSVINVSYSILQTSSNYVDGGNNKPDGTDPLFNNAPPYTAAPTTAGDFHVMTGSMAIDMGDNASNTYPTDLDGMPRIIGGIIDIGPYEKLLDCSVDTLFVTIDGTVPSLPVDSLLLDTIPAGCQLLVNGIPYSDTASVPFSCEDIFNSNLNLLLVCGCDTIDGCTKIVVLIDSFEKNLVCNDLVNVSLGAGCMKVVTPDDVLENVMGCRAGSYDVELVYPFGTHKFPPDNDKLDESHIGYTMVYNVFETLTGNKCWGYLKVEDKLPPLLNCRDTTIPCFVLPKLPLLAANEDDCFDGKVELVSDQWFDFGCDSVLSGYVIRTIQGTDRWGNFRRCTSTIFIERTVLDSVVCPERVELPCEIRTQLGGNKILKTPIVVDQSKVTPAFLLSLQQKIWEYTTGGKDWVLNPAIKVVPQVAGKNIWPGAGGICKIMSLYRDTRLDMCGSAFQIYREWTIVDWCTQEERICVQYIKVKDTIAPQILKPLATIFANASPHDCRALVSIPALVAGTDFKDCNLVDQTYIINYDDPSHPGKRIVLNGPLPATNIYLPQGEFKVVIHLVDKCLNRSDTARNIVVEDITPPTPVCDEYTQVTVDPVTCWAKVKAKDLDNGSQDNCCNILHFAAAHMDSVTYWRKYWTDTLEARCGTAAFWADKEFYDFQIERWINAYVFKDEIKFDECGTSQVVLRVYEACGVPLYDPHVWPCTEHQWFWYNTDQRFRIEHNWNFFHASGPKDCNYRYTIQCFEEHRQRGRSLCEFGTNPYPKLGGLCYAQYPGAVESLNAGCESDFYFPTPIPANSSEAFPPGNRCSNRLYNDCMVNVLVDDKQAPIVAELEDVVVYCDKAPDYADNPDCESGEEFLIWPGLLKDSKGTIHGYYGGSDFLGIHFDNDHNNADACGYDSKHHWAPIYCRSWLYVDSFDSAGHIDPKLYFDALVRFDKGRPTRTLLANEFSITDNCRLDDATLTFKDEGSLNGCSEGWIQRTWTIKDRCGNLVTAKQKVVVKHRSDFEVIFPEDKIIECDFINTTDPDDTGRPLVSDDECEQIGIQYKDEVFTIEEEACYKIVRTWTLIDWCIYDPNAHLHYPDVIVDDRLRADTARRSCVFRNLKDNN